MKKSKVYYDESCYVCSLEINTVRKKGEACGIEFIDISSCDFDSDGRDFESEMIGEFDGKTTIGAETFRKMYESMGFKKSVYISRLPIIRAILNAGYYVFAYWIRPNLPKKSKKVRGKATQSTEEKDKSIVEFQPGDRVKDKETGHVGTVSSVWSDDYGRKNIIVNVDIIVPGEVVYYAKWEHSSSPTVDRLELVKKNA